MIIKITVMPLPGKSFHHVSANAPKVYGELKIQDAYTQLCEDAERARKQSQLALWLQQYPDDVSGGVQAIFGSEAFKGMSITQLTKKRRTYRINNMIITEEDI
jgi:hypothetical protein